MIDTQTPLSPGWWLKRLAGKLAERQSTYDLLDSYVKGENGIPVLASKAVRQSYQRLMAMSRTNYAELLVESVAERLSPAAFRTGAVQDTTGDALAWQVWQGNALDADCSIVHRTALGLGRSYVIVGGIDPDSEVPLMTPEDPRQVTVEASPTNRRKAIAGLKLFKDDLLGRWRAYLYLPGFVLQAVGPHQDVPGEVGAYDWVGDPQPTLPGVVPVVEFANRPDLGTCVAGEFERHLSLLDRINFQVLSRLEIATLQAFRQRAAKGLPNRDEQGREIDYSDVFAQDPGAMWLLPESASIWESGQVDLGPIRQAVRDDVLDLAAVTRRPLHYLVPDSSNQSAEGAALAKEGLIFVCQDRLRQFGESWEQCMSLAFRVLKDEKRASRRDLELVWTPPERFSLAERYDAASKAQAAGVPWESVMSDVLQFSPQAIERMRAQRAAESLLQATLFPAPVTNAGPGGA